MFAVKDRIALLEALTAQAEADDSVTAAAVVGSLARDDTDQWSDIDLALRLRPTFEPLAAADAWSARMRELAEVADTLDVWAGPALYRVFLLADSLQVDISFWPDGSFRSTGEAFRVLFGSAGEPSPQVTPDPPALIGWGWLYALHARSALGRGRYWQALGMINDMREQVITLACLRSSVPAYQGRGVDRLPTSERAALLPTVPSNVEERSLTTAFAAALDRLEFEAAEISEQLARRLGPAFEALRGSVA